MMRWLPFLALLMACFLLVPGTASAQPQVGAQNDLNKVFDSTGCQQLRNSQTTTSSISDQLMSSGGAFCPCVPKPGRWIERIIACFSEVPGGLYYNAVGKIITDTAYHQFYNTVLYATILFAIVMFGVKLLTGGIHHLPRESFVLALKMAGVVWFFNNYMWAYQSTMEGIQGLMSSVNNGIGEMGNICEQQFNGTTPNLWARWDCLFMKFTGLVGGYVGTGILGYLTSYLFQGGTGIAIFFGLGNVIITIMTIAMRMVYTYLVAILAVSFLFLLAPFFVPLIFFGQTYEKFTTWIKLILAYALQPMLLTLLMGLMLTAFEYTIFVGPTSLFGTLSNSNPTKSMTFTEVMSTHGAGGGAINGIFTAVTGSGDDWMKYVQNEPIFGYTQHTDPGVNTTNQSQPDATNTAGTNTGIFGTVPTASGSAPVNPAGSHEGGIKVPKLNADGMANYLGISKSQWLQNTALQLLVSLLMVMLLYSFAQSAPDITHDLIAQRFGAQFAGASKTRALGEDEMKKTLDAGKEVARRGKESADQDEAVQSVLKEVYQAYVAERK